MAPNIPQVSQALSTNIQPIAFGMRSIHLTAGGCCQNLHAIVGCPQEKRRDGIERHMNQTVGSIDLGTVSGEDCGYTSKVFRLVFDSVPNKQHYVQDGHRS
jgi:hypothetical protein